MITNDDDVSYLDIKTEDLIPIPPTQAVWAKISEEGQLEYINWELVESLAKKFDELNAAKQDKEQSHVICKLLVLVRDQMKRGESK